MRTIHIYTTFLQVTWGESRHLCQLIGGDLITFRNVSHFASVIQHLKETSKLKTKNGNEINNHSM